MNLRKHYIGYRVKHSTHKGFYVQAVWNCSMTEVADSWSTKTKGALLTKSEAHYVLAEWLKKGYNGKIVRVYVMERVEPTPFMETSKGSHA